MKNDPENNKLQAEPLKSLLSKNRRIRRAQSSEYQSEGELGASNEENQGSPRGWYRQQSYRFNFKNQYRLNVNVTIQATI